MTEHQFASVKSLKLLARIENAKKHTPTSLNLGSQNISVLPPEIGGLNKLTSLNLAWNRLESLPPELGNCTSLQHLNVSENPLRSPPPEIIGQGTSAILAFLRGRLQDTTQQWVSKLLVVGEGGVGKTQLLRQLRGAEFDRTVPTTHGIEIHQCVFAHPRESGVDMVLNAWDFGGQQIYHATHQFFLTNRSLFVLAWNARLGYEQGRLWYWLETIHALGPDSPVLLVATHTDEREADLPLAELKEHFPRVAGHVAISNFSGVGLDELRTRVARLAAGLPLMGEQWPTSWLQGATTLRGLPDKYASPARIRQILTDCGVDADGQPVLLQWMHELGDLLEYPDDEELKNLIVLKPQWVAEHIGRVLVHPPVVDSAGVFTSDDMEQVWPDLDEGMRQHFLRLMERFDLSYRTLENRELSLVVERLPLDAPDYRPVWDRKPLGDGVRELSMHFALSSVPAGIPTWFIARQHRFTTHTHWRSGAVLTDREGLQVALVTVDSHRGATRLSVRGPNPHDFFALLRDGFELTLARFPGLEVTRFIPCPGHLGQPCHHRFDYEHLLKATHRQPPVVDIQCPLSFEFVSVPGLLFGIHWTTRDVVIEKIEDARADLAHRTSSVSERVDSVGAAVVANTRLVQREFLKQFHRDQRLAETNCPNVFVLTPRDRSRLWRELVGERVVLELYCQAPGGWHPTGETGRYGFRIDPEWLRTVAPYLVVIVRLLKLVVPVAGPWVGVADTQYAEKVKYDIEMMERLTDALPSDIRRAMPGLEQLDVGAGMPTRLGDASLRTLRVLLDSLDPAHAWGGLHRVLTPEGHFLWLCDHHRKEYSV